MMYLSRTYEGKRHDKKIADEENYDFPPGSKLLKDTGFQGYRPAGVTTIQPKKKPRGGELTPTEKLISRAISSAAGGSRASDWRGQTRSDRGAKVPQSADKLCR